MKIEKHRIVIPAQAGIHKLLILLFGKSLDSGLRRNDEFVGQLRSHTERSSSGHNTISTAEHNAYLLFSDFR